MPNTTSHHAEVTIDPATGETIVLSAPSDAELEVLIAHALGDTTKH